MHPTSAAIGTVGVGPIAIAADPAAVNTKKKIWN
jgi:hypothetical protein